MWSERKLLELNEVHSTNFVHLFVQNKIRNMSPLFCYSSVVNKDAVLPKVWERIQKTALSKQL